MSDHRYPLHVQIIGMMCKGNSKLYMASVLWSDQTEVIVYRSLRDFKQLHRNLKKKFPVDNSFHPQNKVLPRFGGVMMKLSLQRKSPARCVYRVKALESYCTELLRCDPGGVSQSSELIRFFIPKEEELHPEFSRNSIMIFQPEDGQPRDLNSKRHSFGNVSQPCLTKLYKCLAPYETKDTKNRTFSVTVGETLEVLIKDQAGWWLVENENKRLAWFPAPYLELCEDEEEGDEELDNAGGNLYCAIRTYTSARKDELTVNIGAIVDVIQKSDDGWWLVRYNGKTGYVPSIYLQTYSNPMICMQKKLHSSNLNLSTLATVLSHPTRKSHFQKFHSVEVLSDPLDHRAPVNYSESDSRKSSLSDDTDFCSSISICPDSPDSILSMEIQSPTNSETSSPSNLHPRVPPRPDTQEILTRCTTYTRKAALETKMRLFKGAESTGKVI